jgi:hypothetical protein
VLQRKVLCYGIVSWSIVIKRLSIYLLTDYTALLELLPPSSAPFRETERSLQSLKPRAEAAQKQETAEMLDKLKGLGNSLLGMSPDSYTILILYSRSREFWFINR